MTALTSLTAVAAVWPDAFKVLLFVHLLPLEIAQLYTKFTEVKTNFCKYWINPHNIAKEMLVYAKVAKFCQIWSHWVAETTMTTTSLALITIQALIMISILT